MQVKELCRQEKRVGETVIEMEADKLRVRLIATYDNKETLEDMIYVIACRRLADKLAS
jgi:hypothetical protein